jgi:hypothetical protein
MTQSRGLTGRSRTRCAGLSLSKEEGLEELELGEPIRADIERYRSILATYRSKEANTDDVERGFVENTKETERHLENVEALLRDRKERNE